MDDFFSFLGIVIGFVLLLPLIIGGIFVVVVVANRAEPDPSGRRPALVYSLGVSFLTLFTTLGATTAAVASLSRLIGSHPSGPRFFDDFEVGASPFTGGHEHPLGDAVARATVLSMLIAIIAGVVCWLHLRSAARASADVVSPVDPLARVRSSYVSAVAFVSVLIAVGASVVVLYDIFRGAAPGVFSSSGHGGSVEVLRSLIPALYLTIAALAILFAHLRYAPPPFRPGVFGRWYGGGPGASEAAMPAPVTAPPAAPVEVISSEDRPAPRKRAPRKKTVE